MMFHFYYVMSLCRKGRGANLGAMEIEFGSNGDRRVNSVSIFFSYFVFLFVFVVFCKLCSSFFLFCVHFSFLLCNVTVTLCMNNGFCKEKQSSRGQGEGKLRGIVEKDGVESK